MTYQTKQDLSSAIDAGCAATHPHFEAHYNNLTECHTLRHGLLGIFNVDRPRSSHVKRTDSTARYVLRLVRQGLAFTTRMQSADKLSVQRSSSLSCPMEVGIMMRAFIVWKWTPKKA